MTTADWLTYARTHADNLRALLAEFHPVNRQPGRRPTDWITAPNAEAACTKVRVDIRKNFEGDPIAEFNAALTDGNVVRITTLLNHAWFGVPESRTCWSIPGFREAVTLIEEPPEDEDGHP